LIRGRTFEYEPDAGATDVAGAPAPDADEG
jgi:hypothetical protein